MHIRREAVFNLCLSLFICQKKKEASICMLASLHLDLLLIISFL